MGEVDEQRPLGSLPASNVQPSSQTGWIYLTLVLTAAVLAAIATPNFMRTCCRGELTACKSNCKNIATALEMYASDNSGRYPASLEKLTYPTRGLPHGYLKQLPTCPAVRQMTYTNYHVARRPDAFSFACCGNNHGKSYAGFSGDATNYPQYHAEQGLLDHP